MAIRLPARRVGSRHRRRASHVRWRSGWTVDGARSGTRTVLRSHVHENDVPLTKHPRRYGYERSPAYYVATQVRALPIVAALVRNRAWWPKPVGEVRRFEREIPQVPGAPRVIATPGHTLGHCSLHFPDRDAVIAGDAIVTLNPYTGRRGPQIVSGAATVDSERALASLAELERTGAATVLVGHGEPWSGGAEAAVAAARTAGPS
jgi:glyoxylase-like metal-dependent hydrolase (beta-lactamase superfamily II)